MTSYWLTKKNMDATMEKPMIRPVERFGRILAGRSQAHVLRGEIILALRKEPKVVIDLDGVDAMSPSFADEVFAKLAVEISDGRLEFENVSPSIRSLARFVTAGRQREQA